MKEGVVEITLESEAETVALAGVIARHLRPGDIVALTGELGTGKTRLVAGACRALGYAGRVRSPSYTLLNIYRGRLPIYHFDLYRWESQAREEELEEWLELMSDDGVSFIEWADRLPVERLAGALQILLRHAGEERRCVTIGDPVGLHGPLMEQVSDRGAWHAE